VQLTTGVPIAVFTSKKKRKEECAILEFRLDS
jgi:hypothetical protein